MKNTGTKMGILTTILSTAAVAIAEENIPATAAAAQGIPWIWWVAPLSSIAGLFVAYYFYKAMMTAPKGNEKMEAIASYVREGAYAYLFSQYRVVAIIFFILFLIFAGMAYVGIQNPFVPVAFVSAGFFSALSGFLGMKTATQASSRTAQGAIHSLNRALQVAFRSGAVMGLLVVSFGLLNIAFWYWLLDRIVYTPEHMRDGLILWGLTLVKAGMDPASKLTEITTTMITFGMGASTQALFARVGGGIFTKAADVGADLVGKVEAGIPEDDPRNPATIADNVGDNVGDVAGMGADLFESYVGSILAAAALGAAISTQVLASRGMDPLKAVLAPSVVAGLGTILSIFGIFVVRCKEDASQKNLLRALLMGTLTSSILVVVALAILAMVGWISWGIFGAVITGLVAGVLIGQFTEYYTSDEYRPTREIAEQAQMGSGTTIITGFANGMMSSALPVVTIAVCIIAAYAFAGGFTDMAIGLYGIGFAAVGMLATLGITLSTDTYGPIADNAGGNAEMSGLGPEIRKKTDALDSLGNTTAATGKGFAIGSAALTALALIASNIEEIRIWIARLASESPSGVYKVGAVLFSSPTRQIEGTVNVATAHISDLLAAYDLTIMNPRLLAGIFIGCMMAFLFCAMTMKAVGRNAGRIVEEVRRQFREMPGIMEGRTKPDYARCVSIVTAGAQKEMILPSLLAIIVPVAAGIVIGIPGVMGLLTGAMACGFVLAVSLNNSGGAWDNAKKYIE
ncbi:MAG: sodium-translocating pyrophosphatase, partial [Phycisphaerae bacterium]|nr:sodium-translocating pyrophosphatase [Phycisphaerae bacterium]